jgi:anti-anti-sigma factor
VPKEEIPDAGPVIATTEREGAMVVAPEGEIDLATVEFVDRELQLAESSHATVVLDLSRVTFMDSTGLHLLIAADQRMHERGGRLVVVPGGVQVRRLLRLTGAAERLELADDSEPVSDPA